MARNRWSLYCGFTDHHAAAAVAIFPWNPKSPQGQHDCARESVEGGWGQDSWGTLSLVQES